MLRARKLIFPYRTMASTFAFIKSKSGMWPGRTSAKSSPVIRTIRGASPENFSTAVSSKPFAEMKKPRVLCAFTPNLSVTNRQIRLLGQAISPFNFHQIIEFLILKMTVDLLLPSRETGSLDTACRCSNFELQMVLAVGAEMILLDLLQFGDDAL